MPALEVLDLYQTAVLWEKSGDDDYAEPTFSDPEEIRVRWINSRQVVPNPLSTEQGFDVILIAPRELVIGSLMYLGTLSAWTGTGSADATAERFQVKKGKVVPDLKNRNIRYEYGLMRFRSED